MTGPIRILLVEDNPGDVRFAQEALREYRIVNSMDVLKDGEEALSYLRKEGKYADVPTPDMILLDLNLPRMDGYELLDEIRADPNLADLPVVILTASQLDKEILKERSIPADCFITKPLTMERYMEAIRCFPHLSIQIVATA